MERCEGDLRFTNELTPYVGISVCLFVCLFETRVSLYKPGWSRSHSADQPGLKLIKIYLTLPEMLVLNDHTPQLPESYLPCALATSSPTDATL